MDWAKVTESPAYLVFVTQNDVESQTLTDSVFFRQIKIKIAFQ